MPIPKLWLAAFLAAGLCLGCGSKETLELYPSGKPKRILTYRAGGADPAHLKREQTFYFNGNRESDSRYRGGVLHGSYASYWHNGQKKSLGKYAEGKREGKWEFYFNQYQLSAQGNFHAGLEDGPWTEYWENGELKAQGPYSAGKKTGAWKEWDNKGALTQENSCFDTNPTGNYRAYYDGQTLKEEYACRMGAPIGTCIRKDPEGRILERGRFDSSGRKDGAWEGFFPDGRRASLRHYRVGVEEDSVWVWDAQGQVRERGFFSGGRGEMLTYDSLGRMREKQGLRNGKPDGEAWIYHANGEKKSLALYQDGQALEMRKWHDNGRLSLEGWFADGKRDGEWKQYDEKGTLRELSRYRGGLLEGERLFYDSNGKLFRIQRYEHGYPSEGRILKDLGHP